MPTSAPTDNPHDLCAWQPSAACDDCPIQGELQCRFRRGDLARFAVNFVPFGIAAIGGMVRAGFGWWLLAWLAYALFFFFVWEARVLCSHCPYWAEGGRTLHCHANYGVYKLWAYRPGPMTRGEQVQFLVGAGLLVAFPFPWMLVGGEHLLTLIALATAVSFAVNLKTQVCGHCVNFSCPLNSVPRPIVEAYLARNPVMRDAWEQEEA